jgi:hypothetical protein
MSNDIAQRWCRQGAANVVSLLNQPHVIRPRLVRFDLLGDLHGSDVEVGLGSSDAPSLRSSRIVAMLAFRTGGGLSKAAMHLAAYHK